MKAQKTRVLSLILCCLLVALVNIGTVLAGELWVPPDLPSDFRPGEENWVEVTRFAKDSVPSTWWGDPSGNTDFFNCDYVEWRIRWEYTPHPAVPQYAALYVEVYEKKEGVVISDERTLIVDGKAAKFTWLVSVYFIMALAYYDLVAQIFNLPSPKAYVYQIVNVVFLIFSFFLFRSYYRKKPTR